jgi:hypothetical protein
MMIGEIGAAEKTRTSTPVKEQRPQRKPFNTLLSVT